MSKPFGRLSEVQANSCSEIGLKIYKELCKRFPERNIENLDSIMNSLTAALVYLVRENVPKDNRKYMIHGNLLTCIIFQI